VFLKARAEGEALPNEAAALEEEAPRRSENVRALGDQEGC